MFFEINDYRRHLPRRHNFRPCTERSFLSMSRDRFLLLDSRARTASAHPSYLSDELGGSWSGEPELILAYERIERMHIFSAKSTLFENTGGETELKQSVAAVCRKSKLEKSVSTTAQNQFDDVAASWARTSFIALTAASFAAIPSPTYFVNSTFT